MCQHIHNGSVRRGGKKGTEKSLKYNGCNSSEFDGKHYTSKNLNILHRINYIHHTYIIVKTLKAKNREDFENSSR